MVDDDTRVLTLVAETEPEATTLQNPITPGDGHEEMPWVEPRRYGPNGPVWDATDEMYITYNEEGERVLVTTGPDDIWNREHSYQRTGSGRYEALRGLAGRASGVGRRVGDATRRLRPVWAGGSTGEYPQIHPDRDRDGTGQGSRGGARSGATQRGVGPHGPARHARDRADWSRVQERPDESRVRSHRHCPGCSGHAGTTRSGWGLFGRGVGAWVLGWIAIWVAGFGLSFGQYVVLTSFGLLVAGLFRPVWREYVNHEERQAKGGRR